MRVRPRKGGATGAAADHLARLDRKRARRLGLAPPVLAAGRWRWQRCQRPELREDAPQRLDAKRQRIVVVVNRVREQLSERRSRFVGKIELYPPDAGYDEAQPGHIVEMVGFPLKLHGEVSQL
jgi:hypothetical protein